MLNKLKNNKGSDLCLNVAILMLIFAMAICMGMDFWMASSAKILIIKDTQNASVYCLVKTLSRNYDILNAAGVDKSQLDMSTYQARAVNMMGNSNKPFDDTLTKGELYTRLNKLNYVDKYSASIRGLFTRPIGEMGIRTELSFIPNALLKTMPTFFGAEKGTTENTYSGEIHVIISVKVVPRPET